MNLFEEEQDNWLNHGFFSKLLNQLPLHIFWKNKDGIYLGCNNVFAKALGFSSPQEVIGKNDFELPVSRSASYSFHLDDQGVINSGKPKLNIEEEQVLSNGEKRFLLTSTTVVI